MQLDGQQYTLTRPINALTVEGEKKTVILPAGYHVVVDGTLPKERKVVRILGVYNTADQSYHETNLPHRYIVNTNELARAI